jgi:RNA-binding protein YlmH
MPDHREILGSLMGLGLGREKFGDIVFDESYFYVFMVREVEDYVLSQLLTVGREPIQGRMTALEDFNYVRESGEMKRVSAASFRLDAVVAALVPTSRSHAQELIKKEMVKVNHRLEGRGSFEVSPGDLISIRKAGRFQLGSEWKQSKKGRLHFEAEKY